MNIGTTRDGVEAEILKSVKESGVFKKHRFNPTSKVYTFVRALANAVYLFVDRILVSLFKAIHPQTAEEADLHEWLRRSGASWKQATRAVHLVRIGASAARLVDIPIAQGQVVHTAGDEINRIRFRTIEPVVLLSDKPADSRGSFTVPVQVECLIEGPVGNVPQDAIALIEGAPDGIDVVYNPDLEPVIQGRARESISSVRSRVLNREESQGQARWTPAWYRAEAEALVDVKRCVFQSAKRTGRDGEVTLLLLAMAGELTTLRLQEIEDYFNLDDAERNPGGAAHVIAKNVGQTTVDRAVTVQFSGPAYVPDQATLDAIAEGYFLSLIDGDDFVRADLRALYFALENCTGVTFSPDTDEPVAANFIAVPGAGFSVTGVS